MVSSFVRPIKRHIHIRNCIFLDHQIFILPCLVIFDIMSHYVRFVEDTKWNERSKKKKILKCARSRVTSNYYNNNNKKKNNEWLWGANRKGEVVHKGPGANIDEGNEDERWVTILSYVSPCAIHFSKRVETHFKKISFKYAAATQWEGSFWWILLRTGFKCYVKSEGFFSLQIIIFSSYK